MGKRRSLAGLRKSNKQKAFIDVGEKVAERDFKLVKERILNNSLGDEWDEARSEWECIGMITEDDYDYYEHFTERCELCNQPGLKTNYKIKNINNGTMFLVGSTCIKRFLLLKGAKTQEESAAIFDFQVKKMIAVKRLQVLLPDILTEPTKYQGLVFRNASKEVLGTLDNRLLNPQTWASYIQLLFGTNSPPPKFLDRVRNILFQPGKVVFKKVTDLSTGEEEGRWADKTKVKTRIELSSARSREDRPDRRH